MESYKMTVKVMGTEATNQDWKGQVLGTEATNQDWRKQGLEQMQPDKTDGCGVRVEVTKQNWLI